MNLSSGTIASFSQDVRNFAFQTNIAQKNVVDIYPLDASNNYIVNSSLVSHIDYESNELKATDVLFSGWCSASMEENGTKVKRRLDEENNNPRKGAELENFYVNAFSKGKIVVFSSGGKQIINIIQLKKDLICACTEGPHIWIIDSDNTVKKFLFNQSKPLKTFQLAAVTQLGDDAVVNFQLFGKGSSVILALACENELYLIDPNKKKPTVLTKYKISGCTNCAITTDRKHIGIATKSEVAVYEFTSKNLVGKWPEKASKLALMNDIIMTLNTIGEMKAYKIGEKSDICRIRTYESEIIDYTQVSNSLMVAWLNVNEPNFKMISYADIMKLSEIIFDEESEGTNASLEAKIDRKLSNNQNITHTVTPKRVSKAEHDELTQSLISALCSPHDKEQISSILLLSTWTEPRIKSFISTQLQTDVAASTLLETTIVKLQENPYDKSNSISLWLKWILTLKGEALNSAHSKEYRRQLKDIKAALKSSAETFPTLLGIQGRLEMLKKQEQLRGELAKLNVTTGDEEAEAIEQGTISADVDSDGVNESISYANGESDTFVDAFEYRD